MSGDLSSQQSPDHLTDTAGLAGVRGFCLFGGNWSFPPPSQPSHVKTTSSYKHCNLPGLGSFKLFKTTGFYLKLMSPPPPGATSGKIGTNNYQREER